ncbi:uncharacterized protein LOC117170520 [Belonocnema kinseyi]|uniref:uncharacterized protein LOC117170520 n=1 Tax=Belonocnema kinseyi TaxID=2817044 RepID=UPI00143D311B|nr:uncharacterized protein LOC117170520 [Belonocnema kinseyi]
MNKVFLEVTKLLLTYDHLYDMEIAFVELLFVIATILIPIELNAADIYRALAGPKSLTDYGVCYHGDENGNHVLIEPGTLFEVARDDRFIIGIFIIGQTGIYPIFDSRKQQIFLNLFNKPVYMTPELHGEYAHRFVNNRPRDLSSDPRPNKRLRHQFA